MLDLWPCPQIMRLSQFGEGYAKQPVNAFLFLQHYIERSTEKFLKRLNCVTVKCIICHAEHLKKEIFNGTLNIAPHNPQNDKAKQTYGRGVS